MRLLWTARASADRREIRHYIGQAPATAIRLATLFAQRAASLRDPPLLDRPGHLPDTRELLAHRHYLFAYDLNGDQIRILRMLHTARQWPPSSTHQ